MKQFRYLILVITASIAAHSTRAQQIDSIRYVIDSTLAKSPFYGNILITHKGKTLFENSYGYSDITTKQKLTPGNSFQIASVSKQFTAYGIMLLQQQHKLGYDSAVSLYLPGFPYPNITVRHLLTHTSGLPDFWNTIRTKLDTTRSYGNKEVLEYLVKNRPALQFEPGSQFDYCDIGYDFLANIIEQTSGLSYTDYLNTAIFKPLGMKQTFAYKVTDIRRISNKQLATGHQSESGQFVHAHELAQNNFIFYLGDFYGDGSIVSSARDLARWERGLQRCELLSCERQQAAVTPFKTTNGSTDIGNGSGYGFGWFIRTTPAGMLVYHTGHHPGNALGIYRLTDREICFIFLSNTDTQTVRILRNRILYFLQQ